MPVDAEPRRGRGWTEDGPAHAHDRPAGTVATMGAGTERTDAYEVKILPPPWAPMAVARRFVADRHTSPTRVMLLRTWRGGFYAWDGRCWPEVDGVALRTELYRYTEFAVYETFGLRPGLRPWDPTRAKVADVLDAVRAVTHLSAAVQPPAWLGSGGGPDPRELLVVANGVLHLPSRTLAGHDARLFIGHALPFAYDPRAPGPRRWLAFLRELWDEDEESIALLQEMFAYAVSGDTGLQKILLLIGPTRAGKGLIANLLAELLGRHNVAGPTLAGLTSHFGLQALIGRTLAVVADARLGPRSDVAALVERLLAISGGDSLTVDRKFRDPWTGRLGVRFLILANELPRFTDASGALAGRFVIGVLTRSFLGHEDPTLLAKLLPELPGILRWSLDGLDRLREQGRFTEPASARELIRELGDLASPVAAFLRDRCVIGPDHRAAIDALWAAWRTWTEAQGQPQGTRQTFGRDLRAAVPGVRGTRPREGDERSRGYIGVGLRNASGR